VSFFLPILPVLLDLFLEYPGIFGSQPEGSMENDPWFPLKRGLLVTKPCGLGDFTFALPTRWMGNVKGLEFQKLIQIGYML